MTPCHPVRASRSEALHAVTVQKGLKSTEKLTLQRKKERTDALIALNQHDGISPLTTPLCSLH